MVRLEYEKHSFRGDDKIVNEYLAKRVTPDRKLKFFAVSNDSFSSITDYHFIFEVEDQE